MRHMRALLLSLFLLASCADDGQLNIKLPKLRWPPLHDRGEQIGPFTLYTKHI